MKKKLLILPVIAVLGYFLISVFMFQRLVNEGSVIADNQCLYVNPTIIERKNTYLNSIQALKDKNEQAYWDETTKYFSVSKNFVNEQTKWLEAQEKYMNRWDFQFFVPGYMKEAAQYQYDSRKADMESTALLVQSFEVAETNKSQSEELGLKAVELIKQRNEAEEKYNNAWDSSEKADWKTRFTKVPKSKCPEGNFDIPDVEDMFAPPVKSDSPLG